MVSGIKNKKKGKMVFAKDKKQAITAMVVVALFVANTLFMIVKAIVNNIQSNRPSANVEQMVDLAVEPGVDPVSAASSAVNSEASQVSAESLPAAQQPEAETVDASGMMDMVEQTVRMKENPIVPVLNVLVPGLLIALFAGVMFFANGYFGKTNFNKKAPKGKLAFAADKKQAMLSVGIIAFFILYGVNMIASSLVSKIPMVAEGGGSSRVSPATSSTRNDIYSQTVPTPSESAVAPKVNPKVTESSAPVDDAMSEDVDIMVKKSAESHFSKYNGKLVTVSVSDSGRIDPFLPFGEAVISVKSSKKLPSITSPPKTVAVNSEAERVMTTTISGILYDKYNPSAIINIEGNDYLVKVGDIINRYKVLSIKKSQVLVQLGQNVYKAGVGELLSKTDLNFNTIANLNKKFGGNSKVKK